MPQRDAAPARVFTARRGLRTRLGDVWRYRELLGGLVRKELKVKYKNSALGFAWSLVNPLLYLVVFYVAFQVILRAGIPSFPIFLLSGLLVWNLFATSVTAATTSIVANAAIVKKVWFPREVLVLASVGAALVHFALQASVLLVVLAVIRHDVAFAYLPMLVPALVTLVLLAIALGILLGALNVYLRDTEHFVTLAMLAWFWMTPIVYPFMLMGDRDPAWQTVVYMLNPVTPVVLVFQRALYATTEVASTGTRYGDLSRILPDWTMAGYAAYLGAVAVAAVILLAVAVAVFGRLEADFAEEL